MIEPHEGTGKIASVKGLSGEDVRIIYKDGSWQEVIVEDIKAIPKVAVRAGKL